ncbi:MAG: hypothetical protein GC192_07040 [Bacteroidetes bacterium]|nr:hypothetical protein [Bacteroidota bacterium]
MSKYTSIILIIPPGEHESARFQEVCEFEPTPGQKFGMVDCNDWNKFPDAFIRFTYVGSYNYFPLADFLQHLKEKVKWEEPAYIQLLVSEEDKYDCDLYVGPDFRLAYEATRF